MLPLDVTVRTDTKFCLVEVVEGCLYPSLGRVNARARAIEKGTVFVPS